MPLSGKTAVAQQRGRRPPQILAARGSPSRWRGRPRVGSSIARGAFPRHKPNSAELRPQRPHRPELRGASHAHAKKGGWGAVCAPLAFCASKIPSFLARWRVRGPAGTGSVGDCVGEGSDEGVQLSKRRADIQANAGIGIVMELCQKSLAKHILETQQQPANWAEVVPHAHAPLRACPSAAPSRSPISPATLSPRTPSWSPRHPNGAPSLQGTYQQDCCPSRRCLGPGRLHAWPIVSNCACTLLLLT